MAEVRQRLGWYNTLQASLTRVQGLDQNTVTASTIKSELDSADRIWKKLDNVHTILLNNSADDAAVALQMREFQPMEKCYRDIQAHLYSLQPAAANRHHPVHVRLPDMALPHFDGRYEDWPTFEDLFKSVIHTNNSLTGSQKLQYLKSCTKGEAATVVNSFNITDVNYAEAWALLKAQYDNKREIITSQIKKLIYQPAIKCESATALQHMLTLTNEIVRSLKVMGRPTDQWDDMLIVLLVEKFDGDTKAEWARSLTGTDPPDYLKLQDFIQQHIRTLHARGVTGKQQSSSSSGSSRQQGRQPTHKIGTHHNSIGACQHCKGPHQLFQCAALRAMDPIQRTAAVKAAKLCLNCLKEGHFSKDCTAAGTCKKCGKRHNTFLHQGQASSSQPNGSSSSTATQQASNSLVPTSSKVAIHTTSLNAKPAVLLKTALVDVVDVNGVKTSLRVFLDEGGEGCLIREPVMRRLGLKVEKVNVTVSGVGDIPAMKSNWLLCTTLFSQVDNSSIDVQLYSVNRKITDSINRLQPGDPRTWTHIEGLRLADPHFHDGGEVDILLGSDIVPYTLKSGLKVLNRSAPVAQETMFGWVLSGNIGKPTPPQISIRMTCHISAALRRFWEIEDVPTYDPLTMEEEMCERHFLATHTRTKEGRYIVRLPFNEKKDKLGGSRDQALRRLRSLEHRLDRQPEYKAAYLAFMREYEQLGHMEKATTPVGKPGEAYYLPHHFVLKEDSTTCKQRTVYDGSAKTTSGVSLNDVLMVGATVQPDLFTLIIRFRYNKVALKADVNKMYRQFIVHHGDRDFQRILWREEPHLPVIEYRLTTVTYGTSCAPFLATRCLNQLAEDEGPAYPLAKEALLTSTYVDDYLGSAPSTTVATELVNQLIAITAKGGMEIRKWCTNDAAVLSAIPEALREDSAEEELHDTATPSGIKALGIKWKPSTDEFLFSVNVKSGPVTKRDLLSEISKTFDPIGWLSPVTINAKLIMQAVWLTGNEWDHPVNEEIQQRWDAYASDLAKVVDIRIPRCVIQDPPQKVELHAFCDSSELAYACALYVKCVYQNGASSVNLLTSRSRVAPLKAMSLPKLELSGAKLLAETVGSVTRTFPHEYTLYCWTDSTITLRWIQSHSRKWKTFVANRVSTIQSLVPPQHWYHVKSGDNPADLPSRGISTEQLATSVLWWHGPSWLQHSSYPISTPDANEEEVKKEERKKQLTVFHFATNSSCAKLFSAFSSFVKLLRCTAYIIRFLQYIKCKSATTRGPLTTQEINNGKVKLIVLCQRSAFMEELKCLGNNNPLPLKSKLQPLNPFIDGQGVLRVGGRLHKANLSETQRHPIILPHDHQLTQLIISHFHDTHLHSGLTLTLATISRIYWIVRGRDTVRHFIRKCITCRRAKATTTTQLMGSLPYGRVTASRPFHHVGVDYAGPFQVKLRKGRHFAVDKAYFSIFVCLATKAVHLEAVTSLTSEAFIACYERFISRRGIPSVVHSDCGTNFVGADKLLGEFMSAHQRQFQDQFASRGTTWKFNPPSAPHQGGLWEAGVKSVKHHFRRVVGQRILQLEEFQTLLCKIEACLNSRPLCALSSDPSDVEALTPGHFLIGEPLTSIPEPDMAFTPENRLQQWENARQLTQHFWKRWRNEYLSALQQRFKWTQKRDNLEVGDLVIIADELSPVAKWRLGRIISTYPGADGLVRSVTVKTATGTLDRPIHKLSPLITNKEF